MKKLFLSCFIQFFSTFLIAQKPVINLNNFGNWSSVSTPFISNDGNYVVYAIEKYPHKHGSTTVVQATRTDWKLEIQDAIPGWPVSFSADSRLAFITKSSDSLGIVDLIKHDIRYVENVASFKISNSDWLVYQLSNPSNTLMVLNLKTGRKYTFDTVSDFFFNDGGETLVLKREIRRNNLSNQSVDLMDLSSGRLTNIFEGRNSSSFIFDKSGKQLAFLVADTVNGKPDNCLYY